MTAFFRRHGLAFFDMLLRAFGDDARIVDRLMEPGAPQPEPVPQYGLIQRPAPKLPFEQVVLLIPATLGGRWAATDDRQLKDRRLIDSLRQEARAVDKPVIDWFERMRDAAATEPLTLAGARDLNHDRVAERWLWQIVHELPLDDQVTWWRANSPWRDDPRVKLARIGTPELRPEDPKGWASAVQKWLRERDRGERYLVNLYGTATENHLAWYYLAWRSPRLKDAVFCECSTLPDVKGQPRFRPISFARRSKDLLSELGKEVTPRGHLPSRERGRARRWLDLFREVEDHFVVLVLGERGTGKSSTVESVFKQPSRPFQTANCANFEDPTMAHSMLFGHVEGAFTGATADQDGLFVLADGGTLFLDEFHKLPGQIRDRLLTALQTDNDGQYSFRPLGGTEQRKVRLQLVLGSNEPLDRLRAQFPEDFWDRIHQRVVEMPPFDKSVELEDGWTKVWDRMKFHAPALNPLGDEDLRDRFLAWLGTLEFPGNFRDLERLGIRTADLQRAEERDLLEPMNEAQAPLWFGHLQREWADEVASSAAARSAREGKDRTAREPALSPDAPAQSQDLDFVNDPGLTPKIAILRFKKRMAEALIAAYGNRTRASVEMKRRDGKTDQATIGRWLNSMSD